jgi:hypothetical protein
MNRRRVPAEYRTSVRGAWAGLGLVHQVFIFDLNSLFSVLVISQSIQHLRAGLGTGPFSLLQRALKHCTALTGLILRPSRDFWAPAQL